MLYIDSIAGNNWMQVYGAYPTEFVQLKYMKDVEDVYVQRETERQKSQANLPFSSRYRETIIGVSLLVFIIVYILVCATSKGGPVITTSNKEELFISDDNKVRYGQRNALGGFDDQFGNSWVKKGPLGGYSKR